MDNRFYLVRISKFIEQVFVIIARWIAEFFARALLWLCRRIFRDDVRVKPITQETLGTRRNDINPLLDSPGVNSDVLPLLKVIKQGHSQLPELTRAARIRRRLYPALDEKGEVIIKGEKRKCQQGFVAFRFISPYFQEELDKYNPR